MSLFIAEISEINIIYNVLKAIPTEEFAIIQPMKDGLKIILENLDKSSEIALYIPAELFSYYQIHPKEDVMFKVQFRSFIDCLHIFEDEGNPSMKLSYEKEGSHFLVIIKHSEENITVDCEFATMTVDDFREVFLMEECNINTIVFNGEGFVEVLNNLDLISDDYELEINNKVPYFRITTKSTVGEALVDIIKASNLIAIFNCKEEFKARYNFSTLKNVMKVMALASKISLSTGPMGLLGLSFIIQQEEKRLHVEYYFAAQYEYAD